MKKKKAAARQRVKRPAPKPVKTRAKQVFADLKKGYRRVRQEILDRGDAVQFLVTVRVDRHRVFANQEAQLITSVADLLRNCVSDPPLNLHLEGVVVENVRELPRGADQKGLANPF